MSQADFNLSAIRIDAGVAEKDSHRTAETASEAIKALRALLSAYPEPDFKVRLFAPGRATDADLQAIRIAITDMGMHVEMV